MRLHTLLVTVLALLLSPLATGQLGSNPPSEAAPITAEQWREALDGLVRALPDVHPNAFFRTPREKFEADAARLSEQFDTLSETDRALSMARLVASLGDPHTSLNISRFQAASPLFPLGLYPASDGVLIIAAPSAHPEMAGAEIIAINDLPISDVIDRIATLYAWENQALKKAWLRQWVSMGEAHRFLGITPTADEARITFRTLDPDAETRTVTVRAVPRSDLGVSIVAMPRPAPSVAAISQRRDPRAMWFDLVPDTDSLYLRYERCANDPQVSIREYTDSVRVRLRQGDVKRLIIDLRANGGGDSSLLEPFIAGLANQPEFRERGSIIVLVGRNTFSSAQLNADSLRRRAGAVVIGEPTGQKPNHYGEVRVMGFPHIDLPVLYSTKFFQTDPADPESMMPDVLIEPTMRDIVSGRDSAFEAAIAFTP
jgi:hypothetical protein